MNIKSPRLIKWVARSLIAILMIVWSSPAMAISIKEEQKLAKEFMKYISRRYEIIDDPAITQYVQQVGRKILAVMPPQPFEYHFYVIKEDVYNAFAIPGGHIFIHSGLLAAMEMEDELAGIIGHEIAHVAHRHISKRIERSKKLDLVTMAGVVAGIFLGVATGETAAAQAMTMGSAAAGQTASLAYSRDDESQADQYGLQYIRKSGYDPQGLLAALKLIRGKQWFGSQQIPTYMMTHPALEDRIVWLDSMTSMEKSDITAPQKPDSKSANLFKKINIRLRALYTDPNNAIQYFQTALKDNPRDGDLIYGYGLTLARVGKKSEAIEQLKKVQAQHALDPVILSDMGRIYFEDGRYQEALNAFESALSISSDNQDAIFYLGRTRMELGLFKEAAETFNKLIQKNKDYKQAYYALGETYGRLDDMPNAHYYLGVFYFKDGDPRTAHFHLTRAKRDIKDPAKLETINQMLKHVGSPKPQKQQDQ